MQRWKAIVLGEGSETEKIEDIVHLIKGVNGNHDEMMLKIDKDFKAHVIRGTWHSKVLKGQQYTGCSGNRTRVSAVGERITREIVRDDADSKLICQLMGPFNLLLTEDERAAFALKYFRSLTGTNMREFLKTKDYSRTVYYRNQRTAMQKIAKAWKVCDNLGRKAPEGAE